MFNIASPEMSVSAVFVKRSIQIWANKGHISSWWHVYSYGKSSFQVCARRIGKRCHNVNLRPRREYRGSTVTQYLGWQVRLRWWLNNEGVLFPMIVRSLASIQMSVLELIAYQTKYLLTIVFYLIKHYIFNAPFSSIYRPYVSYEALTGVICISVLLITFRTYLKGFNMVILLH
jgi:hypothetical protein